MAPLVVVRRKSDGQKGSLMFQGITPVLLRVRAAPPVTLPTRAGRDACPGHSDRWKV